MSDPPIREIKNRHYFQIIWEGKAKWYEIMSMFPTELAAESKHLECQNSQKAPKKHQKA